MQHKMLATILIGLVSTSFLGWVGWASSNIIDQKASVATADTRITGIAQRLERIEHKLDRVLNGGHYDTEH